MQIVNRIRHRWFKPALGLGLALGILLLAEAIASYYEVVRLLVVDHMRSEAGRYISILETRAAGPAMTDPEDLTRLLEQMRAEWPAAIAWIRIADQQGAVISRSESAPGEPLALQTVEALLRDREHDRAEQIQSPEGPMLVVTLPFRARLAGEVTGADRAPELRGRPNFKIAQLALIVRGATDIFRPLERNLAISIGAAIALVASIIAMVLLFPRYMWGRQLEQQVSLASRVQQDLLPQECPSCEGLDFAAEFRPFLEVGGDYYDIFTSGDGLMHIVLGDVAGKGLPAAMLMAVLHGAVRAAADTNSVGHAERARRLNELLRNRMEGNRFISLFWACLDMSEGELRYVNAGHLAPILVKQNAEGSRSIERLKTGGPVLGLLPGAQYEEGRTIVREEDLLVIFSDGVSEATDGAGEEYGEERLVESLQAVPMGIAAEVRAELIQEIQSFVGENPLHDDLSLLVIRFTAG
jgi:serine phosphatase RsbU (regulator of sigma subunit)